MSNFLLTPGSDGELILSTAGYAVCIIVGILLLLVATTFFKNGEKKRPFSAKQLAFCGVALALATVASLIKVFSFPFGGSITFFSMLFICLIGYFYGPKSGLMVAVAYGIIQLLLEPIVYYPLQLLVDYVLAFGALGLAGFFWKKKNGLVIGYLVAIFVRWVFATLSGYVFFGEYAWDGWGALTYSMAYNGAYIFAEGFITVIIILLPPVSKALKNVKKSAIQ